MPFDILIWLFPDIIPSPRRGVPTGILFEIAMNLYISMERTDIFITLRLPI